MGPLKLAPNVAPSINIGINNQPDSRSVSVVNAPDPRAVFVPGPAGGTNITQYSGPAQTWSTPPAPQFKPYQIFGLGLHGFGRGTLRNLINSPFRMGYGALQLGGFQTAAGGNINDGGIKRGTGNLVGGFLDGPAYFVGGAGVKGSAVTLKGLSTGAKIIKAARTGAKLGGVYGGGQGFADTASAGAGAKQIITKTAVGTAEGALAGAALGPAAVVAGKAVKASPDAVHFIKNVVMPNADKDAVMGQVARHLVNSGALQADAERQAAERTQAAMHELARAEGTARATADIGVSPSTKLLSGPANTAVTARSTQVIEGSARLALNYTKERNALIRRLRADPAKLQAAMDKLQAKYVRKHDTMVKHTEKTGSVSSPTEKPSVAQSPVTPVEGPVQSPHTGVTQPPGFVPVSKPQLPKQVPKELVNPTTGKRAQGQSALLEHMRNGDLPGKATQHLRVLTHDVHNQNILRTSASRFVKENPELAKDVYFSNQLRDINLDSHAALGRAVNMHIAKAGDSPNVAMAEFQHHATQLGQGMRSLHEDLLTPEGAISRAMKVADAKGRAAITPERAGNIETMVNKINAMPKGKEQDELIAGLKTLIDNPSAWDKTVNLGYGLVSLPRAIMASTDLSFGLRQGMVLGSRFPGIWARAQKVGAASFVSPATFDAEVKRLANLTDKNGVPLAEAAKRAGIDLEAVWGRSEEFFSGDSAIFKGKVGRKLGRANLINDSDRAYSISASHMRMEIFKRIIDSEGGINAVANKWNTKQLKLLGRVINTGTGRGHGGKEDGWFERAAPLLGRTLFSARLWKSRLDLINPLYYIALRKNPTALKLAAQSGSSFGLVVGATLAAAAAAGATVETDMRSSDFGKIKIGNTRYDIMGGLQQNLVLAWREISGEYKSSSSGQVSSLTSGKYGKATRLTVAGRTVENKLAPVIAEALRQITGTDISGKPLTKTGRLKEAGSLAVPLNVQDTYSTAKNRVQNGEGAKGAAIGIAQAAIPGTFGIGVQTYGSNKADSISKPKDIGLAQTGDNISTADTVKAALAGAKLNIDGQQVKWNDLNKEQKLQLAQTNNDARDFYEKEAAMNKGLSPHKLHARGLSDQSSKVLNYFDHLTDKGKNNLFAREPGAQFAYDQAKFEDDQKSGKFTDDSQLAEAQQKLLRSKTLSTYSEANRHLYGRTKGEIEDYLVDHQDLFDSLIAMDDALYNAGVTTTHKFRNKKGAITLKAAKKGSGSGSSSSSSSSRTRKARVAKAKAAPSPYKYKASRISMRRVRSTGTSRSSRAAPRGPSVAVKRSSRGKIRTSLIKNTT